MAQISQNADGTYSKTHSDTEIAIIRSLQTEMKTRMEADQLLGVQIEDLDRRIYTLESNSYSIADLQNAITKNIQRLNEHEDRLTHLENAVIIDSYAKEQIDAYMIAWKVEQIPHVFMTPTSEMFEKADLSDLKVGYHHFLKANINEPCDHHFPENTMRRYTINAYCASPKQTTFEIFFADRCVVLVDNIEVATYIDAGGNFGGVAKSLTIYLKEGWTKIQFLVANETQQGGLVIESDLYEQADYLSNLDYMSGMITGDRLQAGAIESHHLSPNMDLVVRTIRATATDTPAAVFGDPNGCGIIQIGDKTISKCKDEPFVFDDGIRVNGFIRVSQLLIDVDFVRAGAGIIVDKIRDAETGFTKMYEIINDLRINNGGGLIIVGNGQEGYTITNDLQLKADGGVEVEGNAVIGYIIRNTMKLHSHGGIEVTGNAQIGYWLRNVMNLTVSPGLKVEGNAWRPEGFHLKNQMEIEGDGIICTPSYVDGDGIYKWHLENDTQLIAGPGISITKEKPGKFKIENTGVLAIYQGNGIRVDRNTGEVTVINNGVVHLTGSGEAIVTGAQGSTYNVYVPRLEIQGRGDVDAWRSGNTFYVEYHEPNINIIGLGDVEVTRSGNTFYIRHDVEFSDPWEPPYEDPDPGTGCTSNSTLDSAAHSTEPGIAKISSAGGGYYQNTGDSYGLMYKVTYTVGDCNPRITVRFDAVRINNSSEIVAMTFKVRNDTRGTWVVGGPNPAQDGTSTGYPLPTMDSRTGQGELTYTYNGSSYVGDRLTVYCAIQAGCKAKYTGYNFS